MKILENIDFLIVDDVNQSNIKSLSRMIESESISHAYLFYGNSIELLLKLALKFAAAVNCPDNGCDDCAVCRNTTGGVYPDVLVVEPEGSILRLEEIKKLQKFMGLSSYNSGKKICIITECELMNQEAANRLLKTLEDPPDNDSIFILLAEDTSMILPTVISRCLVYGWNLKFNENINNNSYVMMEKYLNDGIRDMVENKGNQKQTSAVSLNLSLKLIELIKKMEAAVRTDLEKELVELRKSDFDKNEVSKYMEILKSKHKRRINKFRNLAISRIFDIISAWLEDILAVKFGAGDKSLNFKGNYSFIYRNIESVKIKKIFNLMEVIRRNKNYLGYSINPELALDNILLKLRSVFK